MKSNPLEKRIAIIDGHSYLYRAFYGIRPMATSEGQPTHAIFGFLKMLEKILRDYGPSHLALVFDTGQPTFRHERYAAYKAHRKPMPDDLQSQIPLLKEVLSAHRYSLYEKSGFEADDMIGTLSRRAEEAGFQVLIFSSDKDLLQLVGERVQVVTGGKDGKTLNSEDVRDRFGVLPSQIPDLLALAGDASDGIPGVRGIGPKTASSLISRFHSIQKLLASLKEIESASQRAKIEAHREDAIQSLDLATIRTDLTLDSGLDLCLFRKPDLPLLKSLYERLEFRGFLQALPKEKKSRHRSFRIASDFVEALHVMGKASPVSIAVTAETESISSQATGIALSAKNSQAVHYFPLEKDDKGNLKAFLENPGIPKCGFDLKRTLVLLSRSGICLQGGSFDVAIASHLLHPDLQIHHFSELSLRHLGELPDDLSENDIEDWQISCLESSLASELREVLANRLEKEGLDELFASIEIPLIPVLAAMETEGIRIRPEALNNLSKELGKGLSTLQIEIEKSAGRSFNVNSHKELERVLFDDLGLSPIRKTKTGFSTDSAVLTQLTKLHPLPGFILEYRHLEKLRSTYVDVLPKLVAPDTGRIHTSFSQFSTATGRLSSSNPNLQNIPVRSETGRKIRAAFIPSHDQDLLLSADYSQIELRLLADFSKDENLLNSFRQGKDIHRATAGHIFNVSADQVDGSMRTKAKTINFGILYGMSPFGLAKELDMDISESQRFIQNYFTKFPGVAQYLRECIDQARTCGFVTTMYGRKRSLPNLSSNNTALRQQAERIAINTPVQGTAAEIIKIAMIRIQERIHTGHYEAKLLLQIHDELVFSVPRTELILFQEEVRRCMENVAALKVALTVNMRIGSNWEELS